ncbi:AAA family ATPase [Teredinibacter purpureus]|uniref:AAA family ATPase n=1 Tax=Teredinibacter purpureus TaxID=2731756 RepID=UPI0005F83874|nr:AAA family ATPase [Teredinibacter purpureus]
MNNNDLRLILNTNVSLLVVETWDESRTLELLQDLFRTESVPAWSWSCTSGLAPLGFGLELANPEQYADPEVALNFIKQYGKRGAFVLCDMHPYLDAPKIIRQLKDIALSHGQHKHKVVLVSHRLELPAELSRYGASVSISMPTEDEILAIVREQARQWSDKNHRSKIKTDNETLQKLVNNLKGLPHQDVRRLAYGAIADDGAITEDDLPEVTKAKFALMNMEGILHFEYSTAHLRDVAGLYSLKQWLEDRRKAMTTDDTALDPPKGVLLFGVQGGGKSLAAKSIAGVWGLPLLRLDMAALFNKYIGETERNLREALKLADLMSPCVLWLDEIEKGMAQGNDDGGTPKRLLGTLLTWMAERKSRVFMVATSNDISQLPPELMRKGRFDEIFFVDLPDNQTRYTIFSIHLKKRDLDPSRYNLDALAQMSEGYTGAEIEQAVVSATYAAAARNEKVSNQLLQDAIQKTQPLSVVMAEKMSELKAWAKERAVPAN